MESALTGVKRVATGFVWEFGIFRWWKAGKMLKFLEHLEE